jgi:hypothetical protein
MIENITGQTNSLDKNFLGVEEISKSHYKKVEGIAREIPVVTLDEYIRAEKIRPNFVKIDAEGCDLKVLQGASKCLESCRALMIEATKDRKAIILWLRNAGFEVLNEDFTALLTSENLLAIRREC